MTYEEKKVLVLEYLSRPEHKGREFTPTMIAMAVGGQTYDRASSWGARVCLKMVSEGLLIRDDGGWYRVKD